MQLDSGRPQDPARGGQARRLPALAGLDDLEGGLRVRAAGAAAVPALSLGAAAGPQDGLRLHGGCRGGPHQSPLAARGRSAPSARRQISSQIADPELRRKVTPTDAIGCKRIMLTDDWYPTLTKPNVELVTDRIEADHPERRTDGRRSGAPRRRADPRHRIQDARVRGSDGGGGSRRTHPRRGLGRRTQGVPRPDGAGLSEHVPAVRAEHQRGRGLGDLHGRSGHPAT